MGILRPLLPTGGLLRGLFVLLAWCGPGAHTAPAQVRPASLPEEQVKAAYLYNFAKFVDWPGKTWSGSAVLLIGVAGDNALAEVLEQAVRDKKVGDRLLLVRQTDDPRELAGCNIAFLGWADLPRVKRALEVLQGIPVLTVGPAEAFTRAGGMIGLVKEENKIRFDINQGAAERSGLKISAKLLVLARTVAREDGHGR